MSTNLLTNNHITADALTAKRDALKTQLESFVTQANQQALVMKAQIALLDELLAPPAANDAAISKEARPS